MNEFNAAIICKTDGNTIMAIFDGYYEDEYFIGLYEMNGKIYDCMVETRADSPEEAYELQRDFGMGFDFNKAWDYRNV